MQYKLTVAFEFNATSLVSEEREVAQQLFDRCCRGEAACQQWKLANDDQDAEAEAQGAATAAGVSARCCYCRGFC